MTHLGKSLIGDVAAALRELERLVLVAVQLPGHRAHEGLRAHLEHVEAAAEHLELVYRPQHIVLGHRIGTRPPPPLYMSSNPFISKLQT